MAKYYKEALHQLKEELGERDAVLKEANRNRSKLVRAVLKVMKTKDVHTVPEIKEHVQFSTQEIFHAINFLMKYEGVTIVNKRGEFPEYGFVGEK